MEAVKVVVISEEDFLDKTFKITQKILDDYMDKTGGDIDGFTLLLMSSALYTGELRKELFKEPIDGEEK